MFCMMCFVFGELELRAAHDSTYNQNTISEVGLIDRLDYSKKLIKTFSYTFNFTCFQTVKWRTVFDSWVIATQHDIYITEEMS